MEDDKKLAWVVDEGGNAHVNSETLLIREIDSLMRDEDVSSSLLSSFENVFVDSLTEAGYSPKDEYRNILRLAARSHVLRLFGDGAGWMVAENIPDTVYIVVDADDGSLEVGRSHSTLRVRAFFSRERAEKAIKHMDAWNDTSSYRVIKYKMNAE